MKAFHGPLNPAGIAGILSQAERELGIHSISYCLPQIYAGHQADRSIKKLGYRHLSARMELLKFFLQEGWQFDVFHFHFGQSLTLTQLWDVPILNILGKSIFFYFHGCDIRDSKRVISKYTINACREHWPMTCSPIRQKSLDCATKYAKRIFVSTPDLVEFIPGSEWLPQPIAADRFLRDSIQSDEMRIRKPAVTIVHAPTNRMIKGTVYLEKAIKHLQEDHFPVKLILVENMPYDEALQVYKTSDIVVDQLLIGAYGQLSIEAMALGKPVVCYIRDDLREYYPQNLPIISATPHNIEAELKKLIVNRESWSEYALNGRDYVKHVHESKIIAQKTIYWYMKCENKNPGSISHILKAS